MAAGSAGAWAVVSGAIWSPGALPAVGGAVLAEGGGVCDAGACADAAPAPISNAGQDAVASSSPMRLIEIPCISTPIPS
jgi:hypothetical protein